MRETASTDFPHHHARINTDAWEVIGHEPAGAEVKFVLAEPSDPDISWFFKENSVDGRLRYAEDYAEKIASHLAPLLGLPSAVVYLASHTIQDMDGAPKTVDGIISKNVCPTDYELIHGKLWLPSSGISDFVPDDTRHRRGHSIANIKLSLVSVTAPPESPMPRNFSGFDAFAGMCLFDAWISNQDRHEENWAVLRAVASDAPLPNRLSPIYDNGSSLAFNVPEDQMEARLQGQRGGVAAWANKGKATKLERSQPGNRQLGLVEAAAQALSLTSEATRTYWQEKFDSISGDDLLRIAHSIPEMSEVRRTFIQELLELNLERIQNACFTTTRANGCIT
ncbi:hypothetical protein [Glutamicibacter sp. FBE19]|uniref:hypothetical protein n=1 Tax=Glutamicibacter sp. FBE19 TaxID=2761534 RepID=UPI0019D5DFEE|nr:hypothetical protein [Glutamicibacter sp. FBE19]MBF6671394.1 hypothetical protein [Glutamicibacter sp. FBE19]